MKKRVVVAMSGGVDSAVAAALLKSQGYEVVGMTMCFSLPGSSTNRPSCCGLEGIEDARRVAHKLGIRHYVVNMQKALQEKVIQDFCEEYIKGRTPNPCVRCNQYLKFDILLKKARALDAEFLATGHYARIQKSQSHKVTKPPVYFLKKGKDKFKDQSYFLYRLNQEQLKYTLFPLGNYTKTQVRELARKFGLPVADKAGSQEICFLPDNNYRGFLEKKLGNRIKPGLIIDTKSNILGEHQGVAFYTIGQREGLGIALGYPAYIININARKNAITVGSKDDAFKRNFLVKEPHFIFKPVKKKIALMVKIRYNHKAAAAEVYPAGKRLEVRFKTPQFAVTPGQSAVFYNKDTVIGGGIITKRTDKDAS